MENNESTLTMTQDEFNKAIQSAEDKLRTQYSKKIKELEARVPAQKSETELELEQRLAAIEAKERRLYLQDGLQGKNLDRGLVDYIREDADLDKFSEMVEALVAQKLTDSGYKPTAHKGNEAISPKEWKVMSYSEKAKIALENPELAKRLSARK